MKIMRNKSCDMNEDKKTCNRNIRNKLSLKED